VPSIRDKEQSVRSSLLPKVARPDGRCADVYFSADVETDGPIPGPFSILSFALVYAGRFDGNRFERPRDLKLSFYRELKPISDSFEAEALRVNGLDRPRLIVSGVTPERAMTDAYLWVREVAKSDRPVLVAYPLSFDWSWLYWYFVRFSAHRSPFGFSECFDIKTAVAVKGHIPIGEAGRAQLPQSLRSDREHSHNALDDAIEQAEIFAKVFESEGLNGGGPRSSSK
jgi:hypothetical protein